MTVKPLRRLVFKAAGLIASEQRSGGLHFARHLLIMSSTVTLVVVAPTTTT
jgi:hypothetical protein